MSAKHERPLATQKGNSERLRIKYGEQFAALSMKTEQVRREESLIGSYRKSWDWHQSAAL